jgi:hypothetical protein
MQILDEARQSELRDRARRNEAQMQIYQGKVAKANANLTSKAQLVQGAASISGRAYDLQNKTPQQGN